MAKRKRKKTALKRGKGKKPSGAARKKATNRTVRKAAAKKAVKRAVHKKAAAAKERPAQVAAITEETIVDIVEEPASGVMVVTELQTVRTTTPPEGEEGSD